MKRRIKSKKVKAAFTLEAAVVVPIVMVVIVSMLFLAFAVHDCVVMNTVSSYMIMENAAKYPKPPETVQDEIMQMLSRRMILSKNIAVEAEGDNDRILVTGSGEINIPNSMVRKMTGVSYLATTVNVSNLNGRATLLKYKALCDGLKDVTQGSAKEETKEG